jgi:uncharacterized secreted protein with C-terminal beta-propeller domain
MYKVQTSLAKIVVASYMLSIFPIGVGAQEAKIFSDVNSETNYSQAIQYLKDQKIVQGYPDGSFAPSSTINRAEFTKILVNAISKDTPTGSNCFFDVKADWYAPYVCTAKNLNLINGYPDGKFKPGDNINFSEAAKIIANAFKLNQSQQDPSVWFKSYIEALQREKAIPLSVEYFDEKITRDEMSEIIWRVKADINDKSSRTYLELNGEGLVTSNSCSDLEERFKNINYIYGGPISIPLPLTEAAPARDATSSESKAGGGGSVDYSNTNVQVAGVDEADIIKNDGKYIYLIKDNTIRIVNASPASEMKELINFQVGPQSENFYPNEMYVSGDQLIVMGTANVYYPMPLGNTVESKMIVPGYWPGSNKSKVYIVDIKDRSQPKVTRTIDFDGSYASSRRIGDNLYIVLNHYQYFPYYRANQSIPSFSEYLPKISDSKNGGKAELAVPCDQIRLMPKPHSFNFMITAAIPLNDSTKDISRNVIVGNSENIYASEQNLYVASTDWSGGYYPSPAYNSSNTKLYKFALENGKISYSSEGLVPGTILNQFSMDEFRGNFRIATTQNDWVMGKNKMSNNVYVLDSGLKTLGKLENIAPGEKIYSTRFLGNRGYMVTFKSIDPLFAFDLTNPRAPKILGELKIPGYSDYLHPYDENHLIGFGKDVDPAEAEKNPDFIYYTAVKGFKMGLFDVTDPAKPKEMFKEIIGDQGSYSELLYNHKALLFDKAKNLIAFPISVTQNCAIANNCQLTANYPTTNFIGAYVYGLDLQNGFKLKAKITHLNDQESSDLLKNGYGNWEKSIQRILYIGDTLYTVSQGAVKANALSDFRELKMIDLAASLYNITFGKPLTPVQ